MKNITGVTEELEFWKTFVHTNQFKGWLVKGKPPGELNREIIQTIVKRQNELHAAPRVLDVGSGVVSILYSVADNLTATDLLGEEYRTIFDYKAHGIAQPIPISGEELHDLSYDIVHMSNALDHCQDPRKVWENLKNTVAPEGFLIVCGFEREGSFLRGLGMHQWDIWLDDKALVLASYNQTKASVCLGRPTRLLYPGFEVETSGNVLLPSGRNWFIWIARKCKS